jgi:hypothetical protein
MNDLELPVHWRFASGRAFAGLRELVQSFDFLRLANGHTYAGTEPGYLVKVIDGFLGEPEAIVFGGDRTNLHELRKLLVEQIQPAHEKGLGAGRRRWHEGDRVYGSLSTEELHRLALEMAPADEMLRGWFAEGFCFAYSLAEMESLRSETSG